MTADTTNTILLLAVLYGLLVVHLLVRGRLPWLRRPRSEASAAFKRDERFIRLHSNQHLRVLKDYMKN